jgi:hypothetical protein
MAKPHVTRSAGGFNSAPPSNSIITTLIRARAMTRALVDLTTAERDLGDDGGFDPALSAYQAAVGEARTRVLGHCEALIAQPSTTPQAVSLQRVAGLVATVVQSADPAEVERIRSALTVARWVWQLPTTVPGHAFHNATLGAALDALGGYIDGSDEPQQTPPTAGVQMGAGLAAEREDLPTAHTEVSRAFTGALRCLEASVAAERRIQRDAVSDVFAPEVAADLTAAEAAREDLLAQLAEVTALPEQRDLDRPLRLLAKALLELLSVEDDDDRQHMHAVLADSADELLVRGDGPVERRVRALQCRFLHSIARLMSMADYGGRGAGPDDDRPDAPGLAA